MRSRLASAALLLTALLLSCSTTPKATTVCGAAVGAACCTATSTTTTTTGTTTNSQCGTGLKPSTTGTKCVCVEDTSVARTPIETRTPVDTTTGTRNVSLGRSCSTSTDCSNTDAYCQVIRDRDGTQSSTGTKVCCLPLNSAASSSDECCDGTSVYTESGGDGRCGEQPAVSTVPRDTSTPDTSTPAREATGCAAHTDCPSCVNPNEACGWCSGTGCVPIDAQTRAYSGTDSSTKTACAYDANDASKMVVWRMYCGASPGVSGGSGGLCGDGQCNGGEDKKSCPFDCGCDPDVEIGQINTGYEIGTCRSDRTQNASECVSDKLTYCCSAKANGQTRVVQLSAECTKLNCKSGQNCKSYKCESNRCVVAQ